MHMINLLLRLNYYIIICLLLSFQGREYEMDNTMRELGYFGLEEGDTIHVRVL